MLRLESRLFGSQTSVPRLVDKDAVLSLSSKAVFGVSSLHDPFSSTVVCTWDVQYDAERRQGTLKGRFLWPLASGNNFITSPGRVRREQTGKRHKLQQSKNNTEFS
jgi:hypothetical protein